MADTSAVPFHYVKSLSFGVYNSEQIKGLSVKEITNPQTFDTLMHPTFGGLYDPALGPQERDDVCTTCGLGTFHCPGHMGHVSLPLPVYHPLLFTTLFKILKGTCFGCKRMLVTNAESSLLKCQMKLLDKGLVSTAEFLREIYYGLLGKHGTAGDGAEVTEGLEKYTEDSLQDAKNLAEPQEQSEVKNVTESRQLIIKRFLRGDFFCSKKCIHCKHVNRQLRTEHSAKIFFAKNVSKISAAALRKKLDAEKRRKAKLALQEGDADYEEPEDDDVTDKSSRSDQQYLTPMEVRNHLRQVWYIDHALLCSIMGMLKMAKDVETCGTDIFFIDVLPVAPSRFRPISKMGDRVFENAQTSNMAKAVGDVHKLREILSHIRNSNKEKGDGDQQENIVISQIPEKTSREKLQAAWIKLQASVNVIMDSDLDKLNKDKHPGVKQLLEKKDGLFRKHMMGKRVNYAARSVISPDPNISTNEIGIPLVFATCLTYPQPVTPWNFQELKQAVINGPKVHPGAVMVEDENGFCIKLSPSDLTSREAIAKQLLTPSAGNTNPGKTKKVYRHLKNGDYLLLNRQPTLHRPSIQAHKARVLPGQKTLRLHYANCKAYNADFDGDEMNAHFPQNEIGRAEAATLASTDYQYLVPKDGTPLAGLLQDHMVSGVKLTIRGRHFNRADYQQLVYSALTDTRGKIKLLPPCFLKPKMLWSGKQVLSTVLMNIIPDNKPPPTLEGKAKTAGRNWVNGGPRQWLAGGSPLVGDDMSESEVVIHKGELLVGVLDKGHYGPTPYGLIHCCYELYGGAVAGQMLTSLARLFGKFLHWLGFTLGVQDILVTSKADRKRHKMMKRGHKSGDVAAAKALGVGNSDDTEAIKRRFQEAQFAKDDGEIKDLDLQMKGTTDDIQNDIVRVVMPFGLEQRFPDNNLQLMVQAGAKGSSVNCMQISCLLGQIELEGHRPPLMMSGQSLPSFLAYDTSPRSGGFVDGRFLTGIRPQEYYFHCMAGREGLIDTAVKTSRSGYLQRCIIKHLEGLVIGYDMTVRDSDSSVVQFQYGEDGIEVQKNQYLNQKQFPFLIANQKAAVSDQAIEDVKSRLATKKKVTKTIRSLRKKFVKWQHKHPENGPTVRISPFLKWCEEHMDEITEDNQIQSNGRTVQTTEACTTWAELKDEDTRLKLEEKYAVHQPDPFLTVFRPDRHFGVTSEKFEDIIERYIEENPDQLVGGELSAANKTQIEDTELRDMLYLKHIQSLAQPGEAVGLTAAQSIGEPSTQMTLNTFHFAGRGEMNVTLGIPRLREILMVASLNIKTPSMDIPLINNSHAKKRAKLLQQKFTKVYLSQVLEDVQLTEFLSIKQKSEKCRLYRIRFSFLPHEMYKEDYYLTPAKILSSMEKSFFSSSVETIKKRMNDLTNRSLLANQRMNRNRHVNEDTTTEADKDKNEEEDDIVDDDFHDNDAAAMKTRERQMEERDYEGEEEEMEEVAEDASSDEEVEAVGEESQTQSDGEEDGNVEKGNKLKKLKNKQREKQMDPARIQAVIGKVSNASAYSYDAEEELWCEITLKFPLSNKKLDVLSIVNAEARRTVVTQTKGISRCFMTTSKKPGEEGMVRLKTEGVNIKEMYNYYDILDVNRLYSNDIHAMANTYGIEAASRVIIKEIRDVFAAYGIEVDYRHLSLVADYMTFEGKYKPFSRGGIESNASPLQKITFETSMNFLKQATIQGASDELKSPSARIVVGQLVKGGTGAFDLLHPL